MKLFRFLVLFAGEALAEVRVTLEKMALSPERPVLKGFMVSFVR